MGNHHILNSQGIDISSKDTWYALTTTELPDGIALTDISLLELLHKQEKLDVLVPLADLLSPTGLLVSGLLQQVYKLLIHHSSRLGIWINADTDADALTNLTEFLLEQALIVIHVPLFADGRGFSFVQTLRQLGYEGEIRMAGAFGRDQIAYLLRVGADSFVLSEHDIRSDISQAFTALASAYDGQNAAALPMFAGV
ncbi:DUF934 domain-containing protein [Psychrobacter frigidicola]|uniref:DUF934 domain-containing protein n=1 Tax=Psychrobacter frigidicola TaxID=45611 RepID=A0A5C7A3V7_9GAMM|nr:DUF934 domain-containing protein [Psychrobacter frigidicola]TXD97768.1 DUF934 domain-containing protein [Psychrobacter frigidicola]